MGETPSLLIPLSSPYYYVHEINCPSSYNQQATLHNINTRQWRPPLWIAPAVRFINRSDKSTFLIPEVKKSDLSVLLPSVNSCRSEQNLKTLRGLFILRFWLYRACRLYRACQLWAAALSSLPNTTYKTQQKWHSVLLTSSESNKFITWAWKLRGLRHLFETGKLFQIHRGSGLWDFTVQSWNPTCTEPTSVQLLISNNFSLSASVCVAVLPFEVARSTFPSLIMSLLLCFYYHILVMKYFSPLFPLVSCYLFQLVVSDFFSLSISDLLFQQFCCSTLSFPFWYCIINLHFLQFLFSFSTTHFHVLPVTLVVYFSCYFFFPSPFYCHSLLISPSFYFKT